MLFRTRFTNSDWLLRIGLATLVLASLANLFLRHVPDPAADLADGLKGFLYGIAIAAMLLGLIKRRAPR